MGSEVCRGGEIYHATSGEDEDALGDPGAAFPLLRRDDRAPASLRGLGHHGVDESHTLGVEPVKRFI
jgi:hypothetical protein